MEVRGTLCPGVRRRRALQWVPALGDKTRPSDLPDLSRIWEQVRNQCPASRGLVEGLEGAALPALGSLLGKAGLHGATFPPRESPLTPPPRNPLGRICPPSRAASLPLPPPPRLTQPETCGNTGRGFLAATGVVGRPRSGAPEPGRRGVLSPGSNAAGTAWSLLQSRQLCFVRLLSKTSLSDDVRVCGALNRLS